MAFFGLFGGKKEDPSEAFKRRQAERAALNKIAGEDPTGSAKLPLTLQGQVNLDSYTETAATSALLEAHAARNNYDPSVKMSTITVDEAAQTLKASEFAKAHKDAVKPGERKILGLFAKADQETAGKGTPTRSPEIL